MTITGKVIDSLTGAGIPSASVTLVDSTGKSLGPGALARSDGSFIFHSDDINESGILLFSSVTYSPVMVKVDYFIRESIVRLQQLPEELQPIYVYPKKGSWLQNNWWIVVGIGLVLFRKYLK